jgi:hypothetical protein
MRFVPKNGYTEAEYRSLQEKYYAREDEIEAYREEQLQIGFRRLMKVYHHLWD